MHFSYNFELFSNYLLFKRFSKFGAFCAPAYKPTITYEKPKIIGVLGVFNWFKKLKYLLCMGLITSFLFNCADILMIPVRHNNNSNSNSNPIAYNIQVQFGLNFCYYILSLKNRLYLILLEELSTTASFLSKDSIHSSSTAEQHINNKSSTGTISDSLLSSSLSSLISQKLSLDKNNNNNNNNNNNTNTYPFSLTSLVSTTGDIVIVIVGTKIVPVINLPAVRILFYFWQLQLKKGIYRNNFITVIIATTIERGRERERDKEKENMEANTNTKNKNNTQHQFDNNTRIPN